MKIIRKSIIFSVIIFFVLCSYQVKKVEAIEESVHNDDSSLVESDSESALIEPDDSVDEVDLDNNLEDESTVETDLSNNTLEEESNTENETYIEEEKENQLSTESKNDLDTHDKVVESSPDEKEKIKSKQKEDLINKIEPASFRLGDKYDGIIDLKVKLNAIGFDNISETNYFGSWTKTRVEQFQANYGLPVTGEADEVTQEKLNEVYTSPFQVGGSNPAIVPLKEKLNLMGFDGISLTENYGNWTKTRVKEFQKFIGLEANGIADTFTIQKLDSFLEKGFGVNDRHHSLIDMKEKLNKLAFDGISETTYFGSWTQKRLKQFQEYVGLPVTGRANAETLLKLEQEASTPFQVGKRHKNSVVLKEKLNKLGFGHISVTTLYGSFTEKQVRKFQKYYGLQVNGIGDSRTIAQVDAILNSPYQKGIRNEQTRGVKEKLNRLGFGHISVTSLYGTFTEKQVRKFQKHYGLRINGIVDQVTHNKINELVNSPLQLGKRSKNIIPIKENLNALGYDGISLTNYFGSWTEKRLKQFQRDKGLPVSGIADSITVKALKDSMKVRIFLDAGHGGHDPGASDYGLKEKNVVLDIVLSTGKYLSKYVGVVINYSRKTDTFVELEDRAKMANKWKADYFVSFHNNAFNRKGNGFETYIHNGMVSKETVKRQQDVHNYLISKLKIADRGKKEANFNVLRNTNMPSILLEYMFIDNIVENTKLKDSKYRDWLGKVTAEAIANSFNLKKK